MLYINPLSFVLLISPMCPLIAQCGNRSKNMLALWGSCKIWKMENLRIRSSPPPPAGQKAFVWKRWIKSEETRDPQLQEH